jgi:hypothetical protein
LKILEDFSVVDRWTWGVHSVSGRFRQILTDFHRFISKIGENLQESARIGVSFYTGLLIILCQKLSVKVWPLICYLFLYHRHLSIFYISQLSWSLPFVLDLFFLSVNCYTLLQIEICKAQQRTKREGRKKIFLHFPIKIKSDRNVLIRIGMNIFPFVVFILAHTK